MVTWLRKSTRKVAANGGFDGSGTLRAHLDFIRRLEAYVRGESAGSLSIATCYAGCLVGKWLHSENGRRCKDLNLVNALCNSCEEFYEAATNVVSLANTGQPEVAKAALQSGGALSDASRKFQANLVNLHEKYSS